MYIMYAVYIDTAPFLPVPPLFNLLQDADEPHFVNVHTPDITQAMFNEGARQYMLMGSGSIKKKCTLTAENLFEKIEMYARQNMGCCRQFGIVTVLREMMKTGLYYPSARFVIPAQGRGMNMARAQIMYKMIHTYEAITNTDITYIFFDKLETLGKQFLGGMAIGAYEREAMDDERLAAELRRRATPVEGVPGATVDVSPTPQDPVVDHGADAEQDGDMDDPLAVPTSHLVPGSVEHDAALATAMTEHDLMGAVLAGTSARDTVEFDVASDALEDSLRKLNGLRELGHMPPMRRGSSRSRARADADDDNATQPGAGTPVGLFTSLLLR
jgi:hypothetical protein